MTQPPYIFTWMLVSPQRRNYSTALDEFIVGHFRVRLAGNRLEVHFHGPGSCTPESAKALADKYVSALGKSPTMMAILLTKDEWLERTTPPLGRVVMIDCAQESRDETAKAVKSARNELLPDKDTTLRKVYDHFQDAREHVNPANDQTAFSIYKALEEMEENIGGEEKAVTALGKRFKKAKRAANDKRHREGKFAPTPNPSTSLVALAEEVLREYEQYLLEQT